MKPRYIIIAVTVGLMLTGWFLIMVLPTVETRERIKSELVEAEINLKDFENIMFQAPEFFKTHEKISRRKKLIASQLYSKENLLSLFDELESMAARNELQVIEFTPSVEELLQINRFLPNEEKPQILRIVVNLKGSLRSFGAFLEEVETASFYQGIELCRITNTVDGQRFSDMIYGLKAVLGAIGMQ